MLDLGITSTISSLWSLRWTQRPKLSPLPPQVSRTFVSTPNGDLELLFAAPSDPSSRKSPILFIHGGFGCAGVWIPWMVLLSQKYSYPVYALSLRGHGASWQPGYFRLQYLTTIDDMGKDVAAAVKDVLTRQNTPSADLIVAAHSAGGGLAQLALDQGLIEQVKGLALVAAIPNFGAAEVYENWWNKLDPWFFFRGLFHLNHSRSPLSSTRLVHQAFFSKDYPTEDVKEFEKYMSETESMWWPIYYMKSGYVSVSKILARITGWGKVTNDAISQRILVVAGTEDKLMGVTLMEQMAVEYREGIQSAVANKKLDWPQKHESDQKVNREGVLESISDGVRLVVVPGAGHHLQNDLQREQGGEALARWAEQL